MNGGRGNRGESELSEGGHHVRFFTLMDGWGCPLGAGDGWYGFIVGLV